MTIAWVQLVSTHPTLIPSQSAEGVLAKSAFSGGVDSQIFSSLFGVIHANQPTTVAFLLGYVMCDSYAAGLHVYMFPRISTELKGGIVIPSNYEGEIEFAGLMEKQQKSGKCQRRLPNFAISKLCR